MCVLSYNTTSSGQVCYSYCARTPDVVAQAYTTYTRKTNPEQWTQYNSTILLWRIDKHVSRYIVADKNGYWCPFPSRPLSAEAIILIVRGVFGSRLWVLDVRATIPEIRLHYCTCCPELLRVQNWQKFWAVIWILCPYSVSCCTIVHVSYASK